jgi:hypothetical protein
MSHRVGIDLTPKSAAHFAHPVPHRGALAIVTNVGAGCGGRGNITRRMILLRTAKPCGPDTPTLVSSPSEASFLGVTVARKPGRRGEHDISRKAIAQGMPECSVCTCMLVCAFSLCHLHTRPRVQRAPGVPCALCFQRVASCTNPGATRRGNAKACLDSSLRGAKRRSNPLFLCVARWIASLTLAMTVA